MDLAKVYLATRHNTGLKLPAIDSLDYAREVIRTGADYSTRSAVSITTRNGRFFNLKPTEYKRPSSWNKVSDIEGSNRKVRYLENAECDQLTGLRFVGQAHDIDRNLPVGWYCDNYQHETYKPAVWQLPGKDGEARYLSGYLEPWNDGALIDVTPFSHYSANGEDYREALEAAARDANGFAEYMSELERDYQTKLDSEQRIEECREEISEAREEHTGIISELRTIDRACLDAPNLCSAIHARLSALRGEVRELIREIKRLTDEPWRVNEIY